MARIGLFPFFAVLSFFATASIAYAQADTAAKEADLTERTHYWRTKLPFCDEWSGGKFPSKYKRPEQQGTVEGPKCEDGDSVTFNALTCSIGDTRGCTAVAASQAPGGLWWRSPRRREGRIIDPKNEETVFSNDHALGAMVYALQTRNADAFNNWIAWIDNNGRYLGRIPRYCADDRCAFKLIDCPLLDRVALALGQANPICDPLPVDLNANLAALEREFGTVMSELGHIPGADVLLPDRKLVQNLFDRTIGPLRQITARTNGLRQKSETFARALSHGSDIVTALNAELNDAGFAQHDVAVSIYLLMKYGGFNLDAVSEAAHILATKQPENAFFAYLAEGPTPDMLGKILAKCPAEKADKPHPRFQWIWERADRDPDPANPQPWTETMYWDCLFVAALYKSGPLTGAALSPPPGFDEMYKLAEQERARLEAIVKGAIAQANALKHLAELGPQLVLSAGQAMADLVGEVSGILAREKELALLNEISGKLDIVLRNQERILSEIQALRIFVQDTFRNETIQTMNALAGSYASLSRSKPDSAHRAEYVAFHSRLVEITNNLAGRDTPAYIAHSAGVTMALAIEHLYPGYYDRTRFETAREVFKKAYDHWLDPANAESIVTIIATTKAEVDRRAAALKARPLVVEYATDSDNCTVTTTVRISGSLATGYTGTVSTDRYCRPDDNPCSKFPDACFIAENSISEGAVRARIARMLGLAPQNPTEIPVPPFTPSGIAVVDDMNRERIAIIELMNQQARQEVMQAQMVQMQQALGAPLP